MYNSSLAKCGLKCYIQLSDFYSTHTVRIDFYS